MNPILPKMYNVQVKILAIDPGIGRTGWAIIEKKGNKIKPLDYGCIETEKNTDISTRLLYLHNQVTNLLKSAQPEALAVEDLFFNTNLKTALAVGQARGVVILAAAEIGLQHKPLTPLQVKMAVTGYGRATKHQVAQMVKSLLNLKKLPKPDDVTDALAVGVAYCFSHKLDSKTKTL